MAVTHAVATFDGIKIPFYWDEHPPPHFHAEFGHSIEWVNDKGEQIDFGADALREKEEKQAALIALAS